MKILTLSDGICAAVLEFFATLGHPSLSTLPGRTNFPFPQKDRESHMQEITEKDSNRHSAGGHPRNGYSGVSQGCLGDGTTPDLQERDQITEAEAYKDDVEPPSRGQIRVQSEKPSG